FEHPPRILVVDDEPAILRLLRLFLSSERFTVLTASSGEEALRKVAEGVDLVLLDIRMPGMDGIEVCRRIRANPANARLPIIFLTAELKDPESELAGLEAGGDEYLHKPVHRPALIARVRSLLRLANAERDRQLLAQLAQSEKLVAIGQIAVGVAHEVNNPLSFMLSNLSCLGQYMKDVRQVLEAYRRSREEGRSAEDRLGLRCILEDIDALIAETLEGGERVRSIVQNFKSFSRPDDGPLEPVDLAQVVRSTLLLTERELSSRATLTRDLQPALVPAAPKNALQQVALNLVVNAMQALEGKAPAEAKLHIATGTRDGLAWLSVEDTGCGIPEHIRDRIFEPFFTTKQVGVGTGIGLSFCADVIHKLGGAIDVASEEGKGTKFTVRIPVTDAPEDQDEVRTQQLID
ncbi:MAG: response regulator, partial [Myxococcaceae bacterium]|nr:response regulator [Myxococcaceae bacterium]